MLDLFNIFINLLLSVVLGLVTSSLIINNKNKNKHYIISFIIGVYFIILYHYIFIDYRMNSKLFYNESFTSFMNKPIPQLDVPDNTFNKSEDEYYSQRIPITGPLDGLPWQEVIRRVNYIKTKTQYPYKPMTYTDYKTSMDTLLGKDLSGLLKYANIDTKDNKNELKRWYPDLTLNQFNARDCTNYESGHPYSCVQDNKLKHNPNDNPNILDNKPNKINYKLGKKYNNAKYNNTKYNQNSKDNNLGNYNLKVKEPFQSSNILKNNLYFLDNKLPMPTLFKNAPDNSLDSKDISKNLCRGCKVGYCTKGICGSKFLEEGNNHIIDLSGYVKSYIEDNLTLKNNLNTDLDLDLDLDLDNNSDNNSDNNADNEWILIKNKL
jgi:hypothetical protein